MTTTDNRKRILDMLAEGKITADEAERMLTLLDSPPSAASSAYVADEGGEFAREGEDERAFRHEYETVTATAEPSSGRDVERREHRGHIHEGRSRGRHGRADIDEGAEPPAGRSAHDEEQVFSVGTTARLTVKSFNGRIELKAGPDDRVSVRAKIRNPSRVDYRVWQEGDDIFVDARRASGISLLPRPAGAHIFVSAPAHTTIDLATSNGRVVVENIHGSGPVHTSNGRIVLENVRGEHEVHTSNGRIMIDGLEGDADVKTSNGSIEIKRMRGAVKAGSSNGSISFEGEMPEGSDNRLETSNGSVKMRLQGEFGARLNAKTSNGRIRTSLPVHSVTAQGRNHLEGVIGGGGGELTVRTTNGSINIE